MYKNKKAKEIEEMFDSISKEYDCLNRIITFGTDAKNKEEIGRIVKEKSPTKILDIATGTGDIALKLLMDKKNINITNYLYKLILDRMGWFCYENFNYFC